MALEGGLTVDGAPWWIQMVAVGSPFFDVALDEMIGRPFCIHTAQTDITTIPRMQKYPVGGKRGRATKGQNAKVCSFVSKP